MHTAKIEQTKKKAYDKKMWAQHSNCALEIRHAMKKKSVENGFKYMIFKWYLNCNLKIKCTGKKELQTKWANCTETDAFSNENKINETIICVVLALCFFFRFNFRTTESLTEKLLCAWWLFENFFITIHSRAAPKKTEAIHIRPPYRKCVVQPIRAHQE